MIGGFAGVNFGTIANSSSSGPVTGTSDSYLGGLVGINAGLIQDSTSSSSVTGTGGNNIAGGLVGMNFGNVDPSFSTRQRDVGCEQHRGRLHRRERRAAFPRREPVDRHGFARQQRLGTATRRAGQHDGSAGRPATIRPPGRRTFRRIPATTRAAHVLRRHAVQSRTESPDPNGSQDNKSDIRIVATVSPLLNIAANLVNDLFLDKKQEEVIKTSTQDGTPSGSSGNPGGASKGGGNQGGGNAGRPAINTVPPAGLGPLPSGMPPLNETRFSTNEVVMQLGLNLTPEQVAALARQYGLEVISSQTFSLLGRTVYRFRITGGLSVRDAIAGAAIEGRDDFGAAELPVRARPRAASRRPTPTARATRRNTSSPSSAWSRRMASPPARTSRSR